MNVYVFNYFMSSQGCIEVLFPKEQTFSTRNRFRNTPLGREETSFLLEAVVQLSIEAPN